MPRRARLDIPGALHHIIVRGINRADIFLDDQDRAKFIDRLGENIVAAKAIAYAFALMPNHVHLLLRSGESSLSTVMRKTLTWYAIYFNRRHRRTGHLFENRYKSILCEEDTYLLTLVRYIHLNPVRAGIVPDTTGLARYPWSGHRMLVGDRASPWIDKDSVLGQFGSTRRDTSAYKRFMEEGLSQGSKPELVGGGLVRSLGGWSQVVSMRAREAQKGDERILGTSQFVLTVLADADERYRRQLKLRTGEGLDHLIEEECAAQEVNQEELKKGSRRSCVSAARTRIAYRAVVEAGFTAAEVARCLGVTTSTITRAVERAARHRRE